MKKYKSTKKDFFIRAIDKKSYWYFILLYIIGIIISGIAFYILSKYKIGIIPTFEHVNYVVSCADSIYFSIITITSLGYGDFRPIGFGKVVSSIEVLYGLIILAIFVSKLASERTSALVKLTYTSDLENRIREKTDDFDENQEKLLNAMKKNDYSEIFIIIKTLTKDYATSYSFLDHHIKVGHIEGRWAEKLYLRFIRSIEMSIKQLSLAYKLNSLKENEINSIIKAFNNGLILSNLINSHFKYDRIENIHNTIKIETNLKILARRKTTTLYELNDEMIDIVKGLLPKEKPWIKDIHKEIAKRLRLSNTFISKVINAITNKEEIEEKTIIHPISVNHIYGIAKKRKLYDRKTKKYYGFNKY